MIPDTRTEGLAEWVRRGMQREVQYWARARHIEELVKLLPALRRMRGDERTARLVRDVLEKIRATRGGLFAWQARERLAERWRDSAPSVRPGP